VEIYEYPRPPGDTGIGVHWFPDMEHYQPDDLNVFAPELSALGVSWLAMISDLEHTVPEYFIRGLLELGIEPIVRICPPQVVYLDPARLKELSQRYASWGVHYIHVYPAPNMHDTWAQWDPRALPERFMTYLLPCLETLHAVDGIIPIFTPLVPGGDYDDLRFLDWCLDIIVRLGHEYLFDKLAIGMQNYAFNKSLSWGEGGMGRWPCAQPYHTPPGCEDHVGFRLFEWYNEVVRKCVGHSLPLVCCENGVLIGNADHPDFPPIDAGLHAERTVEMCRLAMAGDLPDYVFNHAFWLLACEADHTAAADRWYTAGGEPALPLTVQALKEMEKSRRPMPSPWPRDITMLVVSTSDHVGLGPGEATETEGQVITLPLEEYLKGVLPMEMDPDAPREALKALAVAARGYALAAMLSPRHGAQAAVCNTGHCQAWSPRHDPLTDRAVEETRGFVPVYGGRPVATYHFGHCDGHTRNSEDVWRRMLPYCRSVPCSCGYESLHGHGVGLCQRGAIEMARRGATWSQILAHYYSGISVWSPRGIITTRSFQITSASSWTMEMESRSWPSTIAGSLPLAGVAITVADEWGNAIRTVSGAAAQHGEGGFEVRTWGVGRYTIAFLDVVFQLDMNEQGVFILFRA